MGLLSDLSSRPPNLEELTGIQAGIGDASRIARRTERTEAEKAFTGRSLTYLAYNATLPSLLSGPRILREVPVRLLPEKGSETLLGTRNTWAVHSNAPLHPAPLPPAFPACFPCGSEITWYMGSPFPYSHPRPYTKRSAPAHLICILPGPPALKGAFLYAMSCQSQLR